MTDNQKAIVLEAAQLYQTDDKFWREFEVYRAHHWKNCTGDINPLVNYPSFMQFRRKPKTITVTMPVPTQIWISSNERLVLSFSKSGGRDAALAAIREAMEKN